MASNALPLDLLDIEQQVRGFEYIVRMYASAVLMSLRLDWDRRRCRWPNNQSFHLANAVRCFVGQNSNLLISRSGLVNGKTQKSSLCWGFLLQRHMTALSGWWPIDVPDIDYFKPLQHPALICETHHWAHVHAIKYFNLVQLPTRQPSHTPTAPYANYYVNCYSSPSVLSALGYIKPQRNVWVNQQAEVR